MSTQPLSKKACEIIESLRLANPNRRQPQACITWEERPSGSIHFRKMQLENAGDYMRGHLHHFDHTTVVFTGSFRVIAIKPDGQEVDGIFSAPRPGRFAHRNEGFVLIQADTNHEIIALEDFTEIWCCFSHRGKHGEVVHKSEGDARQYASKNPDEFNFLAEMKKRFEHGR